MLHHQDRVQLLRVNSSLKKNSISGFEYRGNSLKVM